jgi:hypothetical protein
VGGSLLSFPALMIISLTARQAGTIRLGTAQLGQPSSVSGEALGITGGMPAHESRNGRWRESKIMISRHGQCVGR